MLRHQTYLPKGFRKRRERPDPELWHVRIAQKRSPAGFVDVNFSFLSSWLDGETALKFVEALKSYGAGMAAPTAIYCIRHVLKTWAEMTIECGSAPPSSSLSVVKTLADLSALRLRFFVKRDEKGLALGTTSAEWRMFLGFLPSLARAKAILKVDHLNPSVAAPNGRLYEVPRDQIGPEQVRQNLTPKSYRFDLDSFNDELFEPISINASTEAALADFEDRLSRAVKTIYDAALSEFNGLVEKKELGTSLIKKVKYTELLTLPKYLDPKTKINVFSEEHPDVIGNLLAMVSHEMGGIPKPWGKEECMQAKSLKRCHEDSAVA